MADGDGAGTGDGNSGDGPSGGGGGGPAKQHEVVEGEHIFRIAKAAGFQTGKILFDLPDNAELKKARVNPNTLAIGDTLILPDLQPKVESRATNQTALFTLDVDELLLNLTLQNEAREPLSKRAFRFVTGRREPSAVFQQPGDPVEGVTDARGFLSVTIDAFASEGELTVHATGELTSPVISIIKVLIGFLDPANTVRGQRTRLNNMGYFAGFTDADSEQLKWAIEEFQGDHDIKPTGRSDDNKTFNRIAHEHGDLLKSETVP